MAEEEAEKFRAELESLLRAHGIYLTAGQHGDGIVLNQVRADHAVCVRLYNGYYPSLECETIPRQSGEAPSLPSPSPGRIAPDTPW